MTWDEYVSRSSQSPLGPEADDLLSALISDIQVDMPPPETCQPLVTGCP